MKRGECKSEKPEERVHREEQVHRDKQQRRRTETEDRQGRQNKQKKTHLIIRAVIWASMALQLLSGQSAAIQSDGPVLEGAQGGAPGSGSSCNGL